MAPKRVAWNRGPKWKPWLQCLAREMVMNWLDLGVRILTLVLVGVGGWIAIRQLRTRNRAHLFEVYREVFGMIDGVRTERHYLRSINREETFVAENWLDLTKCATDPEWMKHRGLAEKVFRTFDQLGLLVRQGRVPLDAIAPFCVVPILRAWYDLWPYIRAVRRQRRQPSHGWHFENLVYGIVLPGLDQNSGIWEGVREHDFPSTDPDSQRWLNEIRNSRPTDADSSRGYPQRARLWKLGKWG